MGSNPVGRLSKKMKGYVEEAVAEVVGDAGLQSQGRRHIAQARIEGMRRSGRGTAAGGPVVEEEHSDDR